MFSSVPLSILSAVLPVVLAQSSGSGSDSGSYVAGLVDHLNGLGYTEAASVLTKVNSTTSGQQWLSELPNGNYTAFVPDNAAFQNLSMEVSGNDELLSQYLSYHFVYGSFLNSTANSTSGGGGGGGGTTSTFSQSSSASGGSSSQSSSGSSSSASASQTLLARFRRQDDGSGSSDGQSMVPLLTSGIYPNDTIGRTLLNSSNIVMLEGNKSQVVAWTRLNETGNVTLLNQGDINVTNSSSYQNLFINTIDGIIQPPGNLSQALSAVNATSFLSLAQQANVTSSNGNNVTILDALSSLRGFTLFVPSNDAIQNASSTFSGLQNNGTAVMALLGNHAINGTTIYSPDIRNATAYGSSTNFITAAGEEITVASNGTGGLVIQNQNGSNAQIVRPDILLANGVFHIIDNVLVETDSDPSQASSAVLSASSAAAAQSSTDTLPIGGGFATLTSGSMSQSQSASTSSAQSSESQSASSTDSAISTSASSTESSSASTDDSQLQVTNGSPKVVGSPLLVSALGAVVWTFGL
ncbi:hypothetical protein Ac2012v2_007169 [Leucoagaricus gongylophorus]